MKVDRDLSRIPPLEWEAFETALDILCPMHLRLTETGHIIHAAPTLQKLRADCDMVGKRFLEVFQCRLDILG